MSKEEIVRKTINKVRNDKKLNNKEKDYLLCIGNDWFLFKQKIDKAIEYIKEHNVLAVNKEYLPSGIERCCSAELLEILGEKEK